VAAVRESRRVLKKGGRVIISIANAFVDICNGTPVVKRGLLAKGSHWIVNPDAAIELSREIIEQLILERFGSAITVEDKSEVYISAVAI
jgi:ubiquinone/menaquinone biosynthesis C-methylase UbiE